MRPYFEPKGDAFVATEHCAGPWDPNLLHGGATSALIAHLIDSIPSDTDMSTTRLTIDLKRPAPVGLLDSHLELTRQGRNIQNAEISISANGKEVAKATALKIRKADLSVPNEVISSDLPPKRSDDRISSFFKAPVPFVAEADIHHAASVPQGMESAYWFRFGRPLLPGHTMSPLMSAAATGDFCNALGLRPLFKDWTFLNADLTLHFAREPVGDWMMLAARAWAGNDGRALAFGELADEHGYFGRSVQSLVLAKRSPD